MEQPKKIHAVHLLNDFSGSPLVFREVLLAYQNSGADITIYTATPSGNGFLSDLKGMEEAPIFYRWSEKKWLTLFFFLMAQALLFLRILFNVRKGDTVYVNTLLPFGALLAAKLRGVNTILHVHEVSLKPAGLKNFLVRCAESCATEIIFVSDYVKSQYHFVKPKSKVVFNTLPANFTVKAEESLSNGNVKKETVLMLCSLKAYKGIEEFVAIAIAAPNIKFELVLNANKAEVDAWVKSRTIPSNCKVFPSQSDTHPFYERAAVVMNLSRPEAWVETFGMTILEAMAYHCYVITPTVGGPIELLANYKKGIAIDGRNTATIVKILNAQF